MILHPRFRRSKVEQLPNGWQKISALGKEFKDFDQIQDRISRETEVDFWGDGTKRKTQVIDGFEDVLREPIGQGFGGFYNTNFTVEQLTFALSRASHPAITKLLSENDSITSAEAIKFLRQESVLRGLKIIDIGCSQVPAFAVAAGALGADAYTVDAQDINPEYKRLLKGHIVLDLNAEHAAEILRKETGGELDLVTESVLGAGRNAPRNLKAPNSATVIKIADALLKKGGYLYSATVDRELGSALKKVE